MKKCVLIFASVLGIILTGKAQLIKNPSLVTLKQDKAIKQLIEHLPEGWEVKTDSTALYFVRKEMAWIPRENLKSVLACESCKAKLPLSRVINFNMDKRMCYLASIYFKLYVSLTTATEIEKIKASNNLISKEVEKIKLKHNYSELETKYNLDELAYFATGMTKNEIKLRSKYLNDLAKIGYVLPPTHLGEKYALHLVYIQGDIDNQKTDPPGINNELNVIKTLLNGYCEEIK